MYPRNMFVPNSFKNIEKNGNTVGFEFGCKIQYYRGVTLSIIRDIVVEIDGVKVDRDNLRFTIDGDSFTLDEMETVVSYRWRFGQAATITVCLEGGLSEGEHFIRSTQIIAPSYMPMILENSGEYTFTI